MVRWRAHRYLLRGGRHHSPTLQRSWNKHGEQAFAFAVIEVVADGADLIAREQHWIDMLQAAHPQLGFNVGPVAGSRLGVPQSAEARALVSQRGKGRPKSPETRAAMSAAAIGKKKSAEHRANIAIAVAEQMRSPERRAASAEFGRLSHGFKGKRHSAETRENQSVAAKARLADPEIKAAYLSHFGESKGGRRPGFETSEKTRAKMSASHLASWADEGKRAARLAAIAAGAKGGRKKGSTTSPETRAKQSAAHKARWAALRGRTP